MCVCVCVCVCVCTVCSITTCPVASELDEKAAMGRAEQDPDRSASNVSGEVQSHLCLIEWRGKWKCRRGKSTLGTACPAQKILIAIS